MLRAARAHTVYRLALTVFLYTSCLPVWAPAVARKASAVTSRDVAQEQRIKAEFQMVMSQLPDLYDPSCDCATASAALNRGWQLVGEWVTSFLDAHPSASAAELIIQTSALGSLSSTGVQLRGGKRPLYVVAANAGVTGTFFVVARKRNGHFGVVWSIKDMATKHSELLRRHSPLGSAELSYWTFLFPGFHDGPLTGMVHELPASSTGAPRFYVDARTNPAMGSSCPGQISIWEWNGAQAIPLFIHTYMLDADTAGVSLSGELLKIRTKEEMKSIFGCFSCPDPEGVWTLRISPDGVQDLGHIFLDPVYKLVDDLVDGTRRGEDVSALAAPQIAADLRASFATGQEFLGFIEYWAPSHGPDGDHIEVHFGTNGGPCELSLVIEQRDGKPYAARGSVLPCSDIPDYQATPGIGR